MKKLALTMLTVLTCGAAYALPIGNPSEASLFLNGAWMEGNCCDPCDPYFSWLTSWSFRAGFYGDYVFNRHLQVKRSGTNGADINETRISTNAASLVLNLCNRLDVFGTVGTSQLHVKANATAFGSAASLMSELEFKTRFSWSVGGRATLWECDCFVLGLEGQYFQTDPKFDNYLEYDLGTLSYLNTVYTRYRDWQVGLGASYRFSTNCPTFAMVPYAGVKWSGCRWDMNATPVAGITVPDLRNKKHWGWAVGMSFTLCDMIGVTVEGRFADEKAVYVNSEFRF